MEFNPPVIKHINDVLPHIKDKPEIIHVRKENYQILDYVYSTNTTFDNEYARECRGLKFDIEGNIIARPYAKFHNINENEEYLSSNIDLTKPHTVLLKEDGSMIHNVSLTRQSKSGRCVDYHSLMTRMGESEVALAAKAWLFSDDNCDKGITDNYLRLFEIWPNRTFLFEYVGPNNRIVIPYAEENLILTAARDIYSGEYIRYDVLSKLCYDFNIPIVQPYNNTLVNVKEDNDNEGVVIRFDTGAMVKIKSDIYVRKHKSKDLTSSFKGLVGLILADNLDDVLPQLDDDHKRKVVEYSDDLNRALDKLSLYIKSEIDSMQDLSQKDFASIVEKEFSKALQVIMFNARKDADSLKTVKRYITRLSNNTKALTATFEEFGLPIWKYNFFNYED